CDQRWAGVALVSPSAQPRVTAATAATISDAAGHGCPNSTPFGFRIVYTPTSTAAGPYTHGVRCASCGTENPAGKRFCRACGASLAEACPTCGTSISAGDRFCGECGTALAGDAVAPAAATPPVVAEPGTERRLVSVLFADLVGFTSVSE